MSFAQTHLSKKIDEVHAAVYKELPPGDDHKQAVRATTKLSGRKGWVHCPPSTDLKTLVRTQHFPMWFNFFDQALLFEKGSH